MSAVTPLHDPRGAITVSARSHIVRRLTRALLALLAAWLVSCRGQAVYSEVLDAVTPALADAAPVWEGT